MSALDLVFQAVLGFAATFGFAVLFNVPRGALLPAALIGVLGHLLRYSLRQWGASNEVGTFCGALAVGLVGFWYARRVQKPRLLFTVTGIISMVPGIPAYETVVYFSKDDILNGLQSGVRAVLVAGAIAAGLGTARILTETEWTKH
jgi:uncharacterized membrane protein YjjB (DUF3815 family)